MERDWLRDVKVGVFVLGSLILMALAVFLLGGSSEFFEDRYTLYAAFDDVGGMKEGAVVRLAGIDVGEVTGIRFNEKLAAQPAQGEAPEDPQSPEARPKKAIHVTLSVMTQYAPRIRDNSVARIETEGMLGDRYLSLSMGTEHSTVKDPDGTVHDVDNAVMTDGQWLRVQELVQLVEYQKTANEVLADIQDISRKVNVALGTDQEATQASVANVVKSVDELLLAAKEGKGLIHALVYDESLTRRLSATVSNLETTTNELASISTAVRTGDGIAHELIYGEQGEQLAQQLGDLATALDTLVGDIKNEDSLVNALIYDPERAAMVEDLHAAATSLRAVAESIENGDGTAGMLANDPALYEDLRALVGGAQRNKLLRAYIRQAVAEGDAANASPWTPPPE